MFLSPSARGWNHPLGPTRLGPRRYCIHAQTLRSTRVRYATLIRVMVKMASSFTTVRSRKPFISGVMMRLPPLPAFSDPAGEAESGEGEPIQGRHARRDQVERSRDTSGTRLSRYQRKEPMPQPTRRVAPYRGSVWPGHSAEPDGRGSRRCRFPRPRW